MECLHDSWQEKIRKNGKEKLIKNEGISWEQSWIKNLGFKILENYKQLGISERYKEYKDKINHVSSVKISDVKDGDST